MMLFLNNNKNTNDAKKVVSATSLVRRRRRRRADDDNNTIVSSFVIAIIVFIIIGVCCNNEGGPNMNIIVAARERQSQQSRDRNRNSIRGAADGLYVRGNRGNNNNSNGSSSSSSLLPSQPSSDISKNNSNSNSNNNNNVLVPQCDPNDRNSYFSTKKPVDTTTNCDRYLDYCDKSMKTLSSQWTSEGKYIFPNDFYNTVELMYERCSKTCSDFVVGGITEFCRMPNVPNTNTAIVVDPSFNSATEESDYTRYCQRINDDYATWKKTNNNSDKLIRHENDVLVEMNNKRYDSNGITCTTNGNSVLYSKSSPVVMNEALRCAARIQAKNIVEQTIEQNGKFPNNLHTACPSANNNNSPSGYCDDFGIRIVRSGYPYRTEGFGTIHENTAVNYRSPSSVVRGWLSSTSGHCDTMMKQQSLVVTGEVGIGYYERDGITADVLITAQRAL